MKLFLKYFLIIILLCITACTSIKDPKLVSIDNVVMESSDDSYAVLIDIKLYNPNMFPLSSKDVNLELFIDDLFIGEILLINDFDIKKRDTLSLKTKLIIDYKLFKQPVNLNDILNLRVKGSAKVSIFSINYKFDIEHQLRLSDLMEPLLKNNLKESDVKFRAITVKNIRLSTVDIVSILTFKNNFNFDYTIEKLNIEIFDSNTYTNLVGQSSIGNPIKVIHKNNIDIESTISLNTAKLGKSILKNLFRRRYSLFIRANAVIVFNQIQIPITILKQVDYNPLNQEVKIK
jgi:LEA14-like dessication related protein